MEIAVLIIVIICVILCHCLSNAYNRKVKEKYYEGCINWWWSVAITVLLVAAILNIGEKLFLLFLLLTLVVSAISAFLAYRNMTAWGATPKEAVLGSLAQVASAIGIAAAILLVILLLFDDSGKKKRRR